MKTLAYITFDEVVFENRNQLYGAYYLRKRYNKIISTALFITLFIFLLSFATHTIYKNYFKDFNLLSTKEKINSDGTIILESLFPDDALHIIEPQATPQLERQLAFTTPVVTADLTSEITTVEELFNSQSGTIDVFDGAEPGSIIDQGIGDLVDEKIEEAPLFSYTDSAEFPGGVKALYKKIASNLIFPDESKTNGIKGKVFIQFIVGRDGSIRNAQVIKSTVDEGCENAAIRAITLLPKWKPAQNNGYDCASYFIIPIAFNLQGD